MWEHWWLLADRRLPVFDYYNWVILVFCCFVLQVDNFFLTEQSIRMWTIRHNYTLPSSWPYGPSYGRMSRIHLMFPDAQSRHIHKPNFKGGDYFLKSKTVRRYVYDKILVKLCWPPSIVSLGVRLLIAWFIDSKPGISITWLSRLCGRMP